MDLWYWSQICLYTFRFYVACTNKKVIYCPGMCMVNVYFHRCSLYFPIMYCCKVKERERERERERETEVLREMYCLDMCLSSSFINCLIIIDRKSLRLHWFMIDRRALIVQVTEKNTPKEINKRFILYNACQYVRIGQAWTCIY